MQRGFMALPLFLFTLITSTALARSLSPGEGLYAVFDSDPTFRGQVEMSGSVVLSTCSIAMEDKWQSINMGVMPVKNLNQGSRGNPSRINLRLRGCLRSDGANQSSYLAPVRITFDGQKGSESHHYRLEGSAQGAALTIQDMQGNFAPVGQPLASVPVVGDEQGLTYLLQLVPNGEPVKMGSYYAILRFKLDYQ